MKTYFVTYLYKGTICHTIEVANSRTEVINLVKNEDKDVQIQSITVIETK
jgi:hypothetical protein